MKPNLSKVSFWDVDFDALDYEKDKFFIIDKVMNFGLWKDFLEILKFYGKDTIREEIVKSPYLKKDVLNFACSYLNLNPDQFTCYKRRQLNRELWPF